MIQWNLMNHFNLLSVCLSLGTISRLDPRIAIVYRKYNRESCKLVELAAAYKPVLLVKSGTACHECVRALTPCNASTNVRVNVLLISFNWSVSMKVDRIPSRLNLRCLDRQSIMSWNLSLLERKIREYVTGFSNSISTRPLGRGRKERKPVQVYQVINIFWPQE
jgi:hypothetical protein